jgi:hypothetical protein
MTRAQRSARVRGTLYSEVEKLAALEMGMHNEARKRDEYTGSTRRRGEHDGAETRGATVER